MYAVPTIDCVNYAARQPWVKNYVFNFEGRAQLGERANVWLDTAKAPTDRRLM